MDDGTRGRTVQRQKGRTVRGAFKKLGSKVRELWRTTTPKERAGTLVGRRDSDTLRAHIGDSDTPQQHINRPEPRVEPSVAPTSDGSRSLANSGTGQLEASKTAKTTEGDQACRQYISAPHQGQVVSSPPAVIRAGLLPKLSSEQLRKTKTRHHTTYQQGRKPVETVWHVVHVSKEQCWRDKQRD